MRQTQNVGLLAVLAAAACLAFPGCANTDGLSRSLKAGGEKETLDSETQALRVGGVPVTVHYLAPGQGVAVSTGDKDNYQILKDSLSFYLVRADQGTKRTSIATGQPSFEGTQYVLQNVGVRVTSPNNTRWLKTSKLEDGDYDVLTIGSQGYELAKFTDRDGNVLYRFRVGEDGDVASGRFVAKEGANIVETRTADGLEAGIEGTTYQATIGYVVDLPEPKKADITPPQPDKKPGEAQATDNTDKYQEAAKTIMETHPEQTKQIQEAVEKDIGKQQPPLDKQTKNPNPAIDIAR